MKREITELLQDLQDVLTSIQSTHGGAIACLEQARYVRAIRGRIGAALEGLTNEETIVQGYRDDAIDGLVGITKHMVCKNVWTDDELSQTRIGLLLAAQRVGKYLRVRNSQKHSAAVIEPAAAEGINHG